MQRPWLRRMMTIPAVCLLFAVVSVLAPLLVVVAGVIDGGRAALARKPWMACRLLLFGWWYLLGELWALVALGGAGLLRKRRSLDVTYRLQARWARWNLSALRGLFGLGLDVSGGDAVSPGPVIVLSRHASMIDTLIPAEVVTRAHGIRLRYVLKRELLIDPALDIAGSRLPNCFIDRGEGDSEVGRSSIRALASDLGADEGVLIYPEGTRYSEKKRVRSVRRLLRRPGKVGVIAGQLTRVLPPRPGGVLALLEASKADVLILAHRGLEGLATIKDIWSGGLVGSTIAVDIRRIPRSVVPEGRAARVDWLFGVWRSVDEWVVKAGGA